MSVQSEVFLLGLRSSSLDVLLSSEKRFVLSLDYDWQKQRVYWINLNTDNIKWLSLDQKSKGTIIKGQLFLLIMNKTIKLFSVTEVKLK